MQARNSHNDNNATPIQKILFEELEKRGGNQSVLAKDLGISTGYLNMILKGTRTGERQVEQFASRLNRNLLEFYQQRDISYTDFSAHGLKFVPVISWVSAGLFRECVDMGSPGESTERSPVPSPVAVSDNAFALIVEGDSMEPEYRQGDIIIVDPMAYCNSGDRCIVKVDDDISFKVLSERNGAYHLKPLNPKYDERIIHKESATDFKIVGKVVGMWRIP